jgi:hypothetical protein
MKTLYPPKDDGGLKGFLPQPDEFYFTTDGNNFFGKLALGLGLGLVKPKQDFVFGSV